MCHFPEVIYHRQKKFISLKVNNAESVLVTYNMLHIHCHKFGWTLHVHQPLQHRCTQPFHQLWHLKWNKLGVLATCRLPATYESHTDWCTYRFDYTNTPGIHFKHFLWAAASCNFESMLLRTNYLLVLQCRCNPEAGGTFYIHHVYINMEICVGHCTSWWATQAP
jgi:hypothetical protein